MTAAGRNAALFFSRVVTSWFHRGRGIDNRALAPEEVADLYNDTTGCANPPGRRADVIYNAEFQGLPVLRRAALGEDAVAVAGCQLSVFSYQLTGNR